MTEYSRLSDLSVSGSVTATGPLSGSQAAAADHPSLDFSTALCLLKAGRHLTRKCWAEQGRHWVALVADPTPTLLLSGDDLAPPADWQPQNGDLLASDWEVCR